MVRFPKCRTEVLYPTPGRSGREEPITPPAMFVFPPPADVPRRRAGAELHCWFTSEKKSEHLDCTSFPPAIGIVSIWNNVVSGSLCAITQAYFNWSAYLTLHFLMFRWWPLWVLVIQFLAVCLWCPSSLQGSWTTRSLKVPSNSTDSRFYGKETYFLMIEYPYHRKINKNTTFTSQVNCENSKPCKASFHSKKKWRLSVLNFLPFSAKGKRGELFSEGHCCTVSSADWSSSKKHTSLWRSFPCSKKCYPGLCIRNCSLVFGVRRMGYPAI